MSTDTMAVISFFIGYIIGAGIGAYIGIKYLDRFL